MSSLQTGQLFLYLSLKQRWVSNTLTEMHIQHSEQCRKFSWPPTLQKPHCSQWKGFLAYAMIDNRTEKNLPRTWWAIVYSRHEFVLLGWNSDKILPDSSTDYTCYSDTLQKQPCSWCIGFWKIVQQDDSKNNESKKRWTVRKGLALHFRFSCEIPHRLRQQTNFKTYDAICRVPQHLHTTSRTMNRFIGGCPGGLVSSWQIRQPTTRPQHGATMLHWRS